VGHADWSPLQSPAVEKLQMNAEATLWLLRLAGLICSGLIVANFVAAPRLGYVRNLAGSENLVRQIFYVHCGYIVFLITALAVLCLGWPRLLLEPGMGRVVSGFFTVFWGSRVVVQLTYYDKVERRKERFWDVFFLLVFLTLAVIFAAATLMNL
jgi:hypothetical protein|tara:strand:- start:3717 stop:4178 length:462 start_codon:yes stop_codon:yes gene_type:complete